VEKGGIVGRGVLLDYVTWAEAKGIQVTPFKPVQIPVSTLEEIAASQGTTFKPGDILFIRTGYVRGYNQLPPEECARLASLQSPPSIGVESSEAMLRWLWEKSFAAVAGDHTSVEAWPCQDEEHSLHEWLLAGWGMPLGELFDLERLSEECQKKQRWSFFFSSVPLKVSFGGRGRRVGTVLTVCRCLAVLRALRMGWPSSEVDGIVMVDLSRWNQHWGFKYCNWGRASSEMKTSRPSLRLCDPASTLLLLLNQNGLVGGLGASHRERVTG
jgi:hypothetical protein